MGEDQPTVVYTYTNYLPPQCAITFANFNAFADILIPELRAREVISNVKTQVFWCTFKPVAYGITFLLHTVETEESETWFGFCTCDQLVIHEIRLWKVILSNTCNLEWFTAPYGISAQGTIHETESGDERVFGYGYDTHNTDWECYDHHKILFGFQQDGTEMGDPYKPRFILPSKGIFLEGMHTNLCDLTDIPLYVETGPYETESYWKYKEIESGN